MKVAAIAYTQEQLDFVRDNCTLVRTELTERFNQKFSTDISMANLQALRKRNGWKTGRTGCFEKGKPTWNKGKKGYMGANVTSFKKGHKPSNHKPVGSERATKDGYIEVKVAEPRKWKLKHRVLWEENHGQIPKDSIVIFEDGDKTNLAESNLRLISRADNAVINKHKLRGVAPEARPVAITVGQVIAKSGQVKKNLSGGISSD